MTDVHVGPPSRADVARRVAHVAQVLGLRALATAPSAAFGQPWARQLRLGFTELGPVFVKLGQAMASTPALVPNGVQRELRTLLDRLPPFPAVDARRRAAAALGDRLGEFDPEPLSAASVAQVHPAVVDGRPAVVKVLRPGIREQVELDLAVIDRLVPVAGRLLPEAIRVSMNTIVSHFEVTIRGELDLEAEAEAMASARAFFAQVGADDLVIPEPLHATPDVLAMERVEGFSIDDRDALLSSPFDAGPLLQTLLLRLQESMLVQRRFHGDLHAGNVLVNPEGALVWIDWGIVGTLSAPEAEAMGRIFAAGLDRNFDALLDGLSGFGLELGNRDHLARDLETALAPLLDQDLPSVALSPLIRKSIRVMLRHGVSLPRDLILVAKQIAYFDRYARTLLPERRLMEDATEIYLYFVEHYPDLVERILPEGSDLRLLASGIGPRDGGITRESAAGTAPRPSGRPHSRGA